MRNVRFRPAAEKDLARLDAKTQQRVIAALERFAETNQGDIKLLRGRDREFRLRVGKWRVFFRMPAADVIEVGGIDNRGEAY